MLTLLLAGCTSLKSRYAMDNPVYAEKYADGAPKSDVVGKLKQTVDARWVEGGDGTNLGLGVVMAPGSEHWLTSLSYGVEEYPFSWISTRQGAEIIATPSANGFLFAGLDIGVRAQTPTRLAPFAGVGAGGGVSLGDLILRSMDIVDEDSIEWDAMASIYPEVGVHYWVNGKVRLTLLGRYMVTTTGRRNDGWLIGAQLAGF